MTDAAAYGPPRDREDGTRRPKAQSARKPHPRDEWVEITSYGTGPEFLLAVDGYEAEIAEVRAAFLHGHIDAVELERRVGEALGV